ncbi:hypothetical protein HU200_008799 [Digitaria exilis]|uniref:RNase H type-1 domain-containing protein n=1 Tax=Digitaria exilis TaxID=1010633 RepID=A0A835FK06_9POAL|nr:hypothetical protein HU200_008799 [Digitaria exilis]
MNIKHRGIQDVDTRCPVCRRLDEDGGHCFLKCKIVWWDVRNKANAEAKVPRVEEVLHRTMEVAFQSDRRIKTSAPSVQRQEMQRWHPPPVDVLKINTDGSFREKEKDGAWGFVIRDSEGHGVLAGSGRLVAVHDALSAEGEACLAAIHAAMARGISQVIIETDSANLASALRSTSFDQAVGGAIFREARDLLSLHFSVIDVVFVPRSCNQCAHELARSGLTRDPDNPSIWNDPLPSFVNNLVGRDHIGPSYDE